MSSILDAYTGKKGKKEWDKLSSDAKSKLIESALLEKLSPIRTKEVSKSVIIGEKQGYELLYNRFLIKIDGFKIGSDCWLENVEELLSYLRIKHLDYLAEQARNNNKNGENTNET